MLLLSPRVGGRAAYRARPGGRTTCGKQSLKDERLGTGSDSEYNPTQISQYNRVDHGSAIAFPERRRGRGGVDAGRLLMKLQTASTKSQARTQWQVPNTKQSLKQEERDGKRDSSPPPCLLFSACGLELVCYLLLMIWSFASQAVSPAGSALLSLRSSAGRRRTGRSPRGRPCTPARRRARPGRPACRCPRRVRTSA